MDKDIPKTRFSTVLSTTFIVGGLSAVLYGLTRHPIASYVGAVSVMIGGLTAIRVGLGRSEDRVDKGIPYNKFSIVLPITFIVGGLSVVLYGFTRHPIAAYVATVSVITGGIAVIGVGFSWLAKLKN